MNRRALWLLTAVGMFTLSGASCPRGVNPFAPPLPAMLPPSPTVEQVIDVVNRNNGKIESLEARQATLSMPGPAPTLKATLAFQRPQRLRLRADLFFSPELDLGSNDTGFWFWIKRSEPPAVHWCRHDQFATSAGRQMIPIEPAWLIEALGVATIDPSLPNQGPFELRGGSFWAPERKLEIRTIRETAQGASTKVTVVDAKQGWILEQRLYDPQGRLLASSVTSGHQQDPATGAWVPRQVQIECPPAQFTVKLDLGPVLINQITGDRTELFAVPSYPGSPLVDLGNPNLRPPTAGLPPGAVPPGAIPPGAVAPPAPTGAPTSLPAAGPMPPRSPYAPAARYEMPVERWR